jgi:Protein of unknown function (DUF3891)
VLIVPDDEGVLAIGQASHAWLSGQLARAWEPSPREEVCLAAEQHDVGMAEWDLAPKLHPSEGRPLAFTEMDVEDHLRLWSAAPDKLLSQSRYAALLVSMHGCALYARRDDEPVRAYLDRERARQERLIEQLDADRDELSRNQRLVAAWDGMSLALCLGWEEYEARDVTVRLSGLTVDPWPFAVPELTVRCEGRRLVDRYETEGALHAALEAAPTVALAFSLRPA